jgi:hypothetical protein
MILKENKNSIDLFSYLAQTSFVHYKEWGVLSLSNAASK